MLPMLRIALAAAFGSAIGIAQLVVTPVPQPVPPGTIGSAGSGGRAPARPGTAQREYKPEELCTIEGNVKNANTGEGLSKANITAYAVGRQSPQQGQSVVTDSSGKFSLRGLEPGQYRISVRRNGYVSSDLLGGRSITPSAALTLLEGQTIKGVEAKLIPHAVITGRITDSDGEPVAGAMVNLLRLRYSEEGRREMMPGGGGANSNDLGEYRIYGIPPGKYYVSVATMNRQRMEGTVDQISGAETPMQTYFPGAADPSQATAVDVQMGHTQQGIDIRMQNARAFRVAGNVVGLPAGMNGGISLVRKGGSAATRMMDMMGAYRGGLRPNGAFSMSGVHPGSYEILVEMFAPPDRRLRGAADVQVGEKDVDNVEVTLQPAFEIEGVMRVESGGAPVEFQSVRVMLPIRDNSGPSMMYGSGLGQATADGKVTLKQVFPGLYDVYVGGFPSEYIVKSIRAGEVDVLKEGLRATPGVQVEILLSPKAATISGNVTNEKGDPVSSGSVLLIAPSAPRMSRMKLAMLDQQGQFRLTGVAPGDYHLFALEQSETGAYWDPEFLTRNEKFVQKISIREGGSESKSLKIIRGEGQ